MKNDDILLPSKDSFKIRTMFSNQTIFALLIGREIRQFADT